MDKVKVFLEKYVEWLALGIGAAFLLYMIYANVVEEPVTSVVGPSQAVPPSQIDPMVWDTVGKTVAAKVKPTAETQPVFEVPTFPAVKTVLSAPPGPVLPKSGFAQVPPFKPLIISPAVIEQQNPDAITKLPTAPAPISIVTSHGHTNVIAAAPGQESQAAGSPSMATDVQWISYGSSIPTNQIQDAFKAVKITPEFNKTVVLRVYGEREIKQDDGNWSAPEPVGVPAIEAGPPLPPLPAETAPAAAADGTPPDQALLDGWRKDVDAYKAFADANPIPIMEPVLFRWQQGDVGDAWYVPGTAQKADAMELRDEEFDPSKYKTVNDVPDEFKKRWEDWHKAQFPQQPKVNTGTNGTNPNGTGTGQTGQTGQTQGKRGGKGGKNVLDDPDRPIEIAAGGGSGGGGGGGGYSPPDNSDVPRPAQRNDRPADVTPAPQVPGQPPSQEPSDANLDAYNAKLPRPGTFDPSRQPNLFVWGHDDQVQPGKTYRYRMRYMIMNPVATTTGVCNPQSLADTFSITSPFSEWSEPVVVEADANFYAVKTSGERSVTFDIYHWKSGVWQKQEVTALPGDMIGHKDPATGTDFTTGWTLLDVRDSTTVSADDRAILLVSENGTIKRRDVSTDRRTVKRQDLEKIIADAAAKANPGAGTPPAQPAAPRPMPGQPANKPRYGM
jgi:hypothetical protein